MKMSRFIPNEVDREEDHWQWIFEKEPSYLLAKENSFKKFSRQWLNQKHNWLQKFWFFLEKRLYFLYEPKKVFSIGLILSLTCLSLFLLLLNQIKNFPTNPTKEQVLGTVNTVQLISSNITFTSLRPDEKNAVSSMENCDLGIKFPRKIANRKIEINQVFNTKNNSKVVFQEQVMLTTERDLLDQEEKLFYPIKVTCYSIDQKSKLLASKNSNYKVETWTREKLEKETNWYLTQSNLENILHYSLDLKLFDQNLTHREIIFDHQDKVYEISFTQRQDKNQDQTVNNNLSLETFTFQKQDSNLQKNLWQKLDLQEAQTQFAVRKLSETKSIQIDTISFKDLQFQFNSVAQNDIEIQPKVNTSLVQPLQASDDYSVGLLTKCDLAFSFRTNSLQKDDFKDMDKLVVKKLDSDKLVLTSQFLEKTNSKNNRSILEIQCSENKDLFKLNNRLKKEVEPIYPYFLDKNSANLLQEYQSFISYNKSATKLDLNKKQYNSIVGENLVWMSTFKYKDLYYKITLNLFDQDPQNFSQFLPDIYLQINSLAPSIPNL